MCPSPFGELPLGTLVTTRGDEATITKALEFKNVLYSKTTQEFNRSVKIMKKNIIYRKYENFKNHIEAEDLPQHAEWSMRERF